MEAAKGYYRNIGTESAHVPFNPEFHAHRERLQGYPGAT